MKAITPSILVGSKISKIKNTKQICTSEHFGKCSLSQLELLNRFERTSTVPNENSSWTDLISESVHTSDDQDIGDIEPVSRNFIVVKKGLINVRRYYIPLHRVEGWDGKVLWLKIPEETVKTKYERNAAPDH